MKINICFSVIIFVLISCEVYTQNVKSKDILCTGIDIVSLGENTQLLRSNLKGKFKITEYYDDSTFLIGIGANDFVSIVYYNNTVTKIGVFSQKYKLDSTIFIGMKIDSLKTVLPNMEVFANQHDSYEYIEFRCGKNIIEILVESQKNSESTVGIYTIDSDRTQKFDINAFVTGFIIRNNYP